MATKPTEKPAWIPDNTSNITDPGALKTFGYTLGAVPVAANHNWLFNRISQWVDFIDTFYDEYVVYVTALDAKTVSTNETLDISTDASLAIAQARVDEINYIGKGATLTVGFTGIYGAGKTLTINEIDGPGNIAIINTTSADIERIALDDVGCRIKLSSIGFATTGSDSSLDVTNCRDVEVEFCDFASCAHFKTIEVDNSRVYFPSNSIDATVDQHSTFMTVTNNARVSSGAWFQNALTDITTQVFDISFGGEVFISGSTQPYKIGGPFVTADGGQIVGLLGANRSEDTVTFPGTTTSVTQAYIDQIIDAHGKEIPADTIFEITLDTGTHALTSDIEIKGLHGAGTFKLTGNGTANTIFSAFGFKFTDIQCRAEITSMEIGTANTNGVQVENCRDIYFGGLGVTNPANDGFEIINSHTEIEFCDISQSTNAIDASFNSKVLAKGNSTSGSTNSVGSNSSEGAIIHESGSLVTATTPRAVATGGVVVQVAGAII